MLLQEATDQYNRALRLGQRERRDCTLRGRYPYPQVLEEILDESLISGRIELGLVEVPIDLIVGTTDAGRKTAFSAGFMPLLPPDTEFAVKWIRLCTAHLGDEGIRDPIRCTEYMGRFYVQEGNKRVSVLKSYGARTIPGIVTRMIPIYSSDPAVQVYYAFMQFYRLAGLYQVQFRRAAGFSRLQAALGFSPDHVWTQDERQHFLSCFQFFQDAFQRMGGRALSVTPAEALLVWLQIYSLDDLLHKSASEILQCLSAIWPDVKLLTQTEPIAVSTDPQAGEKGLLNRLFSGTPSHLSIAFLYQRASEDSQWTAAHDLGRQQLELALGSRISTRVYCPVSPERAEAVMEQAIHDGAQVIFATTPPLIGACRKVAARYPAVKILNCSVAMPYAGVRTYYTRVYEGKFITGAIAGAIAREDRIGYVASYPIFGVPASINAFAMGARITNPRAKIQLYWSCTPGDPMDIFTRQGIRVISNRDVPSNEPIQSRWGTFLFQEDGTLLPLGSPCWNWGRFYEKMVRSILDGSWDVLGTEGGERAVNYWWGIRSGVVDVRLSPQLPDGLRRLAMLLRENIISGALHPLQCDLRDQSGTLRNPGSRWLSPDDILRMDWLCDNVIGTIPTFDQLLPMSQATVRLQGIYRDRLPPEKEGIML